MLRERNIIFTEHRPGTYDPTSIRGLVYVQFLPRDARRWRHWSVACLHTHLIAVEAGQVVDTMFELMSLERWTAIAPSRFGKLGEYGRLEFRSCLEITCMLRA